MDTNREEFWREYYTDGFVNEDGTPVEWLDHSNEKLHAQVFSSVIQAAGPLRGSRCLDVGCGWGHLLRIASALGAECVGIELVERVVVELIRRYPQIDWRCGSFSDSATFSGLDSFDCVFATEMLQYADIEYLVPRLWSCLNVGGRLVLTMPNSECVHVQKAESHFEGRYRAYSGEELISNLSSLQGLGSWRARGFSFGEDQTFFPYEVTEWAEELRWTVVPNRLQFVVEKV